MTVCFYLHPGSNQDYARPAIECAVKRSGCNVAVVSDSNYDGVQNVPAKDAVSVAKERFGDAWKKQVESRVGGKGFAGASYAMYLCLAAAHKHICPLKDIAIFDWDMLCGGDLTMVPTWMPCYPMWMTTSAFFVRDADVLEHFSEWSGRNDKQESVMVGWSVFADTEMQGRHGKLGPSSVPYVDFNLHTHSDHFETDGSVVFNGLPCKKIHWDGNTPYFKQKKTGWLVPALALHCWGHYKHKISDLANIILS